MLKSGTLLSKSGPLLLELGELRSELSKPDVFLTALTVGFVEIAIEELLLLGGLALIDFTSHAVQLAHLLHLAKLALFNPLSQLTVKDLLLL